MVHVESRVAGLDRGQAADRHVVHRQARRRQARRNHARGRFRLVFRLSAHASAEHRVKLIQHHGGEGCEDEELKDLHG